MGAHQELFSRCNDVLLCMCDPSQYSLTTQQLSCVWAAAIAQHHGTLADTATDCLNGVVKFLSEEHMAVSGFPFLFSRDLSLQRE